MRIINKLYLFIPALLSVFLIISSCNQKESEPPETEPDIVEAPTPQSTNLASPEPEQESPLESVTEPDIESSPEEKPQVEDTVEVNQVIGSFKTTILDKSESRINNIKLASAVINGYVVQAGEEFSFNKVVGERSVEKGYKDAIVIKEGERAYEPGGGICQISSTLFNAAQQAGMEIIERHSHEKEIHYLPLGQDAAIAYGSMDFRFKNIKNFPIRIAAYIEGDQMITAISRAK